MMLTWKDAVATLFMAAIVSAYMTFLNGTTLWLISSARGTSAAVLALGIVGGCALSGAGDLYTGTQTRSTRAYAAIATTLGIIALAAAVAGLISGSKFALAVLVCATVALWLASTIRHACTVPAEPGDVRDVHEVIYPEKAARH